ncbi:MAG: hypothetical protein GY940_22505 [bacterium]|nr:hypothetical protein [bacterium]
MHWQATDAVMAALAMRKALVRYNEELEAKTLPELAFGIGIHQTDLLITQAVREKLDHRFSLKPMTPARVKGKQELIATYLVEGLNLS